MPVSAPDAPAPERTNITIAHLGDLHIGRRWLSAQADGGVNLREDDLYRVLEAVTDHLTDVRPDVVVIAGDVFDSVSPTTRARSAMFRACRDLADEGMELLIVAGNHDHASSSTPSPLVHLAEFFGCELALAQGKIDLRGVRFHLLPYQPLAAQAAGEPLAPFEFSADLPNVLVSHGYLSHPELGAAPERVQLPLAVAEDANFDLVLLGHIHQHRKLGERIFYSGAIERLNLGEIAATPGFWMHRISSSGEVSSESVPIASLGIDGLPRAMIQIQVAQAGRGLDALNDEVMRQLRAAPREGSVIQIRINDADLDVRQSAYPRLWREEGERLGAIQCDYQIHSKPLDETLDAELAPMPSRLDEGYRAFLIEEKREDLVDLALTTLAEVDK